tara:strand:+ start:1112 stop:1816 length:705 start_codon:yes stop_codon:yes gene_type:complete
MSKLITQDPHMLEQIRFAQVLACHDSPVLVTGESGTGKEHFAEILHGKRTRKDTTRGSNFVPVNTTTLAEDLFESLMYGHMQGSFTGATRETGGLVQHAEDGTLFLDEIGELPLSLQPKLLRYIQERKFRKVGASKLTKSNCRIICSTNKDLREMVKDGSFRLDLFHRISVFVIQTTPIRDRPDDLNLYIKKQGFDKPKEIATKILKLTPLYGNYRELQSILARYKLLGEFINY